MNVELFDIVLEPFTIVLLIIICGIYAFAIIALKKFVKEKFLKKKYMAIGIIFGLMMVSYLTYNVILHNIKPTDWAQIFPVVVLAIVTGLYALATFRQSHASEKMAEEMKKQRYTVSQPLILPDFVQARFPEPGEVWFHNLGNGPALNIEVTFAYAPSDIVKSEWIRRTGPSYSRLGSTLSERDILKSGEKTRCKPELAEKSAGNIGTAFTEYSDIYGRRFLAGYEYRCEKDNNGNVILYATKPLYPVIREEIKNND